MKQIKHVSLRMDEPLIKRMKYVANYNGRSGNGQVLFLIQESISKFEEKHGEITNEMLQELDN